MNNYIYLMEKSINLIKILTLLIKKLQISRIGHKML